MTVLPKKNNKETVAGLKSTPGCVSCVCAPPVNLTSPSSFKLKRVFLPFLSVTRETLRVSHLKSLRQFHQFQTPLCFPTTCFTCSVDCEGI